MSALARGRAALDTITSGEWNYHRDDADGLRYIHDMDTGDMCIDITANWSGSSVEDADLEFIAAAPGLVRDLCDEIQATVDKVRALHQLTCEQNGWNCAHGDKCPMAVCTGCDNDWPCPTIQAIGEAS